MPNTTKKPIKRRSQVKLSSRPDLVAQLHPTKNDPDLDPGEISIRADDKLWWQCPVAPDHVWPSSVASRARGSRCWSCTGKQVSVTNALVSLYPEVAAQFDHNAEENAGIDVAQLTFGSKVKAVWRCPLGPDHTWPALVFSRTRNKSGCPCCSGQQPSITNCVATTRPDLAAQLHPSKNEEGVAYKVTPGSKKELWWFCPEGPDHEWEELVQARARAVGCPFCKGHRVSVTNCLASMDPDLAVQFADDLNGCTPADVVATSETSVWWRCDAGHEWEALLSARTRGGTGCPYCSGHRATPENNLAVKYPEIAAQFDATHPENAGLDPTGLTPAASTVVRWICPVAPDHSWPATVGARTSTGRGCRSCAGRQASVTNSLASLYPELAAQFDVDLNGGLTPDQVVAQANDNYWWRCPTNPTHTWEIPPYARVNGNGCPDCRLVGHSQIEIRLAHELATMMPVEIGKHRVNGAQKQWDVDIVVPEWRLIIEYDGEYWHRDSFERDLAKSEDLTTGGWTVIRVRADLDPVGDHDVRVTSRDDEHSVAQSVLRRILSAQLGSLSETAVERYAAHDKPQASPAADAYIAKLQAAAAA